MKKLSVFLVFSMFLSVALFSCKDETPTTPTPEEMPDPYLSYKFDGVEVELKENLRANRLLPTVPDRLSFSGKVDTANWPALNFYVALDSADYMNGMEVTANKANLLTSQMNIWIAGGKVFQSSHDNTEMKVKFTKVEFKKGAMIEGTFSGSVNSGGSTPATITEGKFLLEIVD